MIKIDLIHTVPSKFTRITNILLIVVGISMFVVVYIIERYGGNSYFTLPLLGLFFIIAAAKFIRSCIKKEFITVGSLLLNDDSILIKTPDVIGIPTNLKELEAIIINYNGYLGESFPFSANALSNFQSKDGNKNYVQLVRKTHTVEFEFFLANNAQRINLIRQLRVYRKKGLSVLMTNDEGDDMLLPSE